MWMALNNERGWRPIRHFNHLCKERVFFPSLASVFCSFQTQRPGEFGAESGCELNIFLSIYLDLYSHV